MEFGEKLKFIREEKGLTQEELAFYDALVADPEVLKNLWQIRFLLQGLLSLDGKAELVILI